MRIKLNQRLTISGHANPPPRGSVVEVPDDEARALIGVGYAKETNEALTNLATFAATQAGGSTPPVSGIKEAPAAAVADADADAPDYEAILAGTIPEVSERLAGEHGLDAKGLKALAKAEGKGKDRAGVHAAIDKAAAALEGGE